MGSEHPGYHAGAAPAPFPGGAARPGFPGRPAGPRPPGPVPPGARPVSASGAASRPSGPPARPQSLAGGPRPPGMALPGRGPPPTGAAPTQPLGAPGRGAPQRPAAAGGVAGRGAPIPRPGLPGMAGPTQPGARPGLRPARPMGPVSASQRSSVDGAPPPLRPGTGPPGALQPGAGAAGLARPAMTGPGTGGPPRPMPGGGGPPPRPLMPGSGPPPGAGVSGPRPGALPGPPLKSLPSGSGGFGAGPPAPSNGHQTPVNGNAAGPRTNGAQWQPSGPTGSSMRPPPMSGAIAPSMPGTSVPSMPFTAGAASAGGPSTALLAEQLESIALGPETPGGPDATDAGLFPRPLIGDGETGPTEEQLKLPAAPFEAGNCDPRIMRPTVAAVPNSMSLKASWHLPMAIVLQPLQQFGASTPVIDGTQPHSIMRCGTCRSYMNPFNKWLAGGRSFQCCICGSEQAVAEPAFVPLGSDGLRQDHHARPELSAGSVEFIAPADYTVRPPMPPCYFFVIDVSQGAVASGGLAVVCAAIASTLDALVARNSSTKVGFLTYDSAVHFYNLNASLPAAQMMVVADIDDPFPPLPDEHYVTLEAARSVVDSLLGSLPSAFAATTELDSAMAAALQAAFRTISHLGGKLMLFAAAASTAGAVKTKNREVAAHYNTDREPALRQAGDAFFRSFAAECIQYQICVDVYALSAQYCDLFSLAFLPRCTGGSLHFYPAFNGARDGAKLTHELTRALLRYTGWEAVMRMRCSKGMRVSTFHGHIHVRSNDLVVLPSVHEDSTYVAQIAMDDSVITEPHIFVQCALLYTSPGSERRIRVHTMRLPVVATSFELFNHADAEGTTAALAKLGVDKALTSRLDETRDVIQQKVSAQLQEFKSVHQGHFRQPAHLAYPRQLRYLLPWAHGLLRGNALRGGADVSPDERAAVMSMLLVAPADLIILAAYPAVFSLHTPGWAGPPALPPTVPASVRYMDPQGAYLIDAGYLCILWLGASAPQSLVQDLFGPGMPHCSEAGDLVRVADTSLDAGAPARLGDLARALLAARRSGRSVWPLCFTVVQGSPTEGYFAAHFVEDRLPPSSPGYHEFLMHLHKSLSLR